MSYYSAPFTFDFNASLIKVDDGYGAVNCIPLYSAIKLAQASEEGILYDRIASGNGLTALNTNVKTALTVELLGSWQLFFISGYYTAIIDGGNLVGSDNRNPIAYSAGVQPIRILSANATVVETGTSGVTIEEIERSGGMLDTVKTNTDLIPAAI